MVPAGGVAAILLAHGDDVPVSKLGGAWEPALPVLVAAAIALLLFAQAFVRLRRRGRKDHAAWSRAFLFSGGLAILTLALVSPLDAVGEEYLLSAHMLQHVLVGDAAPALLLVALRGPLVFFFLPARILSPLARLGRLRRVLAFLLRPRIAFALWVLAFGAWHIPAAYDAALAHPLVHDLEHASFALAGVLAWTQLVDPARRGELGVRGRVAFAVALFAAGLVLSDVLIFSFDPLYGPYALQDERLLGLSPLTDQRLAGLVMMLEQALTLGTFAALTLRGEHRRSVRSAAVRP
jgi:cytochrome c oxidase assembly factor CtaG